MAEANPWPADPGRLWLVAPDLAGGALGGPPPEPRPQARHLWLERIAALGANRGAWVRWPYADSSGSGHARDRLQSRTDPELYQFTTRTHDGRSWLYGIRLDTTETPTCRERCRT